MNSEQRESKIYFPEQEKHKEEAKQEETEARGESERRLHSVTKKEAEAAVEAAEKLKKTPSGIMRAEFKRWWEGKGEAEGAKELAKWVFDSILDFFVAGPEPQAAIIGFELALEKWETKYEPSIKRLAEEIHEHGGQEHVWQYFQDEWQTGMRTEVKKKVWDIWQKYYQDYHEKK